MSSRRTGGPLLLLPLAVWGISCGDESIVETTRLVLKLGTCELSVLGRMHSVQVTLKPSGQAGDCLLLTAKTLDDLQTGLSGKVTFRGLAPGEYTLRLRGFEDKACAGKLVVCSATSFQLPAESGTVSIPVDCYSGSTPPPAFALCAGQ